MATNTDTLKEVMTYRTLFIIKPDAIQRNLIGKILSLIEENQFKVHNITMLVPQKSTIELHYKEHYNKAFYNDLVASMLTYTPIVVGTLSLRKKPKHVVKAFRDLMGHYDNPAPDTLRYHFMVDPMKNAIHGSSDDDAARREMCIWSKWL